jgi:hypothetical protein
MDKMRHSRQWLAAVVGLTGVLMSACGSASPWLVSAENGWRASPVSSLVTPGARETSRTFYDGDCSNASGLSNTYRIVTAEAVLDYASNDSFTTVQTWYAQQLQIMAATGPILTPQHGDFGPTYDWRLSNGQGVSLIQISNWQFRDKASNGFTTAYQVVLDDIAYGGHFNEDCNPQTTPPAAWKNPGAPRLAQPSP